MTKLLTGPIKIEQVIQFIESISMTFHKLNTQIQYWSNRNLYRNAIPDLPVPSDIKTKLANLRNDGALGKIPDDIAASVAIASSRDSEIVVATHIFNLTKLEDILNGNTFPAVHTKYLIETRTYYQKSIGNWWPATEAHEPYSDFLDWLAYLDKMVNQAQERIDDALRGVPKIRLI